LRSILVLYILNILVTFSSNAMEEERLRCGSGKSTPKMGVSTPSSVFQLPPLANIIAAVKQYDPDYALDRRQPSDLKGIYFQKGQTRETFFSALQAAVRNGLLHQRQVEAIQFYISSLEQPKPPKAWVPSPQAVIDACNEVNKDSKLWKKQEDAVREAYERFLRHKKLNILDEELMRFDNGNGKARLHRNHRLAILSYIKDSSLVAQCPKSTPSAQAPQQQLPLRKPSGVDPSPGSPWKAILKREAPSQEKPSPVAAPSLAPNESSDSEQDLSLSSHVLARYLELEFTEVQSLMKAYFANGYPDLGKCHGPSEESRSHDTSEEETEEIKGEDDMITGLDYDEWLYSHPPKTPLDLHWVDTLLHDPTEGSASQRIKTPPESEVEETS
jgi:hypothetical protein